jgi:hypothetical protein
MGYDGAILCQEPYEWNLTPIEGFPSGGITFSVVDGPAFNDSKSALKESHPIRPQPGATGQFYNCGEFYEQPTLTINIPYGQYPGGIYTVMSLSYGFESCDQYGYCNDLTADACFPDYVSIKVPFEDRSRLRSQRRRSGTYCGGVPGGSTLSVIAAAPAPSATPTISIGDLLHANKIISVPNTPQPLLVGQQVNIQAVAGAGQTLSHISWQFSSPNAVLANYVYPTAIPATMPPQNVHATAPPAQMPLPQLIQLSSQQLSAPSIEYYYTATGTQSVSVTAQVDANGDTQTATALFPVSGPGSPSMNVNINVPVVSNSPDPSGNGVTPAPMGAKSG